MTDPRRALPLLVLVASLGGLASLGGCSKRDRAAGAPPATTSGTTAGGTAAPAARHAMLEVHDALTLELTDAISASDAASQLGALASAKGGYVESSEVVGRSEEGLVAHVVLRVPAGALDAVRAQVASLRAEHGALAESLSSKDVTEAIADLDARLHAARAEEARLLQLLADHTGTLADVLAVEHVLSDVRERVERMESEQRVALARVELATVDVSLRAHAIEPAVGRQIVEAATDGARLARGAAVGTATLTLRAGPTLALFGALLAMVWLGVRRLRARLVRVIGA